MGNCFKHQKFCTDVVKTSFFGRIYKFEFPNGMKVEVSRNMTDLECWVGKWRVAVINGNNGIRIESIMGYEWPKEVADTLMLIEMIRK